MTNRNKLNTYKKVCLSDVHFIHHKTWFFDTDRSWFFDMVDWQGKTNCKWSIRVIKIKGITANRVIPLKIVCGITMDTTDKIRLEAKSTVKTSSNTFIKTKTLDSLDVTCVLVGVAVNLLVCIDKLEVNSHSSTS